MEKQMEALATILNELRDERRRDCEIPVRRDDAGAELNLRRCRVEETPPQADQPYGVHPPTEALVGFLENKRMKGGTNPASG